MNLQEAKDLFNKHRPNEAAILKGRSNGDKESVGSASLVWLGFKKALEATGQLTMEEKPQPTTAEQVAP